ncbi:TIR domain-containing protein [Herbidospora mongoliensis]|uniref:TIR domain-containing protein n=1 Tax=Herbidospora mongoliensis TaxID=688067 RepID=UPI00082E1FA1|nr:TIR domain-containing protein [Herbidospora mongoliensis]
MSSGGEAVKWDFFISYTAHDKDWAAWVAWQLEAAEYRVLIQLWDFTAGAHWMASMELGMAKSRRTIAVCSDAYFRSDYGRMEWQGALQGDSAGAARSLIPIRITDCTMPPLLKQIVYVDLFGLPEDDARTLLLEKIEQAVTGNARPSRSPAFPGGPPARVSTPGLHPPTPPPPFPGRGGSTLTSAVYMAGGGSGFTALTERDPSVIGPYRLRGRFGAGLLSTVYLGTDDTGRSAAVKTSGSPERLEREARYMRKVRSAHTPAVLGVGTAPPYLATEYADGPTLAQRIARRGEFTERGLHQFAVHLLAALGDVHRAGVVHGDVSGGNVVLSSSGPRLIDFGAARPDGDRPHTLRPEGTANVMAPELWRNSVITTAADVFAWGCLVTYAGTRYWPFPGTTEDEVRKRVLRGSPDLAGLGEPVRNAVREALRGEATARPTADTLLAWLTTAQPARRAAAAPRFDRRALLATGAAVLAANVGLAQDGGPGPSALPRDPAGRADAVASAADRLRARDAALAARLDLAAYLILPTPRTRVNLLRHAEMTLLGRHSGTVRGLAADPGSGLFASAGDDEIWFWDLRKDPAGQGAEPLRAPAPVYSLAFGPDGALAFGDSDGMVTIARPEGGDPRNGNWRTRRFPAHPRNRGVLRVRFSRNGRLLATSCDDGTAKLWNPADPTAPIRVLDHANQAEGSHWVWGIDFCAADQAFVTAGDADGGSAIKLWSLEDLDADRPDPAPVRRQVDRIPRFSRIGDAATDPADDRAVIFVSSGLVADQPNDVRVLRLRPGNDALDVTATFDGVTRYTNLTVALSPDGALLATGNDDPGGPTVRLWDRADTTVSAPLPGLPDKVWAVGFGSDGRHLVAGAEKGGIGLWRTDPDHVKGRLERPSEEEWRRLFPSLPRPER